ncbi:MULTISPECIES: beta strand repeat-containing protein [unclassified Maribacter]|uniref:beta strand repeat-containing protein n=1 Tax=unclassified Maribacter TaxID=2615042 RepID=UPI00257A1459|nr:MULTISPECIES: hypothetical protein [unclassified Maribacter]
MKAIIFFIFFIFLALPPVFGQIKIGDNPQNIDASSVLELESSSKVLVITRVNTLEMEAITPQRGGLVYNTDTECVNYYDGTQWVNLCDAVNFTITNDPIINGRSTIEITESAAGYNLEVAKNSILGDNIIDGGIGPDDIQDNSITQDKLAAESVGSSELRQNAVGSVEIRDGSIAPEDMANTIADQVLTTDENGIVQWEDANDLFDLTFDQLDNTLTISRSTTPGVSTISLEALVGSDDQQLTLENNILTLQDGGTPIDLSTYTNTGTDEQTIATNGTAGNITILNGNEITLNVDDADANASNELQNIEEVLSDGNDAGGIRIENIGAPVDINDAATKAYVDTEIADVVTSGGSDPVNEQNTAFDVVGGELIITDIAGTLSVPLTSIDTDTQLTDAEIAAFGYLKTAPDNQQLTLEAGNQLSLTNDGTPIDLTPFLDDQNASEVPYDNAASGLTATNTQAAIDKLAAAGFVDSDDQDASQVDYDNTTSGLTAANTQAAIDELAGAGFVDTDEQTVDEFLLGTGNVLSLSLENDGEIPLTVDLSDLEESTEILANTTLINDHIADDGDTDDQNEIELPDDSAATAGDILSTDAAGTYSWITPLFTNTDEQTVDEFLFGTGNVLSLSLENDGVAPLTIDLSDLEESTEILANTTLINDHIADDGDTDDQNEIELPDDSAATAGDILSTDAAGTYSWITPSLTDTDEQTVDEFLFGAGNLLSLSIENDGVAPLTVDLSDLEESTEILANTTLINDHIADDGDTDDQNEIELPDDSAATAGDILSTDAAGTYSWITPTTGQNITNANLDLDADRTIGLAGNNLYFTGLGSIGIGTITPSNKLHVAGAIRSEGALNSNGTANEPAYRFNNDTNIGMYRIAADRLGFSTDGTEAIRIDNSQNVGIGPTFEVNGTTIAARLHVDGDIRAEGAITASGLITQSTPDYVFQKYFLGNSILNPSYEFNTLAEIEAFVKENNHLPGIQSAQAVKEQGFWNVSESSRVNLEKIEELFLHTIEQEKKIKELQKANTNMSSELEALKTQMEEIKTMLLEKQNN